MPQPRTDDRKIVAFPVGSARPGGATPASLTGDRGRVVPFTGVRCERFPDEASFAAAVAALTSGQTGRVST